ncbi:putative chaperone protein [Variovorax boronicumulans]|uniref:Chaperone protein n=1 Tax=Variovorax boronicumulans TaxID=436515 RepID=A0AAW8DZ78_9BURK|nr:Hsp70 family protein [Variovorax boronicumulans]MDP9879657.1 putative chaperone protein [Variovorax boronicumulans]MDP9918124.1 putative chaperone protein [Variovorax boronicumulans]MDP9924665.1 putative chaperone protein [Variovorax boronicumulans]
MNPLRTPAIGIDFGTSNSAVSFASPGEAARLLPIEGSATTLPTALFFNAEDRSTHFGRDAIALYLSGVEGRLMRSLKSLLGSPLMQEKTAVYDGLVSFEDIIARFLHELVTRAERELGQRPERVVIGRPVHFVDDDAKRDQRAEESMRHAARAAGLRDVSFQYEPIAAAFDYEQRVTRESLILIVDIGGGTSDFTVVRLGPERMARADRADDVLATSGVHIGGTDFDQRLNLERVMPLLGLRHLGPSGREVPSKVFFELSSWHLINWLYAPKVVRQARELRTSYSDRQLHDRLMTVLEERHGHRIASEVEQAKINGSVSDAEVQIDLSCIEAGLASALTPADMAQQLAAPLENVVACAHACVKRAGLRSGDLDAIYLTGGSSALRPFQRALRASFAGVPLIEGDLLGGVAAGLAYSARTAG